VNANGGSYACFLLDFSECAPGYLLPPLLLASHSMGEIDPEFGEQPYLLAWEEDGQALLGERARVMLVPPGRSPTGWWPCSRWPGRVGQDIAGARGAGRAHPHGGRYASDASEAGDARAGGDCGDRTRRTRLPARYRDPRRVTR
jgi:hypothetical protein